MSKKVLVIGRIHKSEAQARLREAAPELYKAAKLQILNFKRQCVSGNTLYDDDHEAWVALQKAVDKAEGK